MNETRHVEWEQVADLIAYLMHLEDRTPGFESATDEDVQTARRIEESLMEQSNRFLDQDDGSSLAPEWEGELTLYTLDAADWSFMKRWFCDNQMGRWKMDRIGGRIAVCELIIPEEERR